MNRNTFFQNAINMINPNEMGPPDARPTDRQTRGGDRVNYAEVEEPQVRRGPGRKPGSKNVVHHHHNEDGVSNQAQHHGMNTSRSPVTLEIKFDNQNQESMVKDDALHKY